eukprot:7377455-Prymnesium_polylepis.1
MERRGGLRAGGRGGCTHRELLEIVAPAAVDELLAQLRLEPARRRQRTRHMRSGMGARVERWLQAKAAPAHRSYSPLCSSLVWIVLRSWASSMALRPCALWAQERLLFAV